MAFFVPGSEEDIDWGTDIKFLDKEFQKLTKESVLGQRHTDKLVEVTLENNSKKWILIHIEVQAQNQLDFLERMFVYALFSKNARKIYVFFRSKIERKLLSDAAQALLNKVIAFLEKGW
ncbi:MAG: hypothetical protein AB7S77_15760, partial [Desulfatirhabdiaceae bacterium]